MVARSGRAAASSPRVSTIQRLFHEHNAERPITAESFFKPYEHLDVLIQEKGIRVYREAGQVDQQPIYDMIDDYRAFLARSHREKPYEALAHDMTLLHCARRLRSNAGSSLDARALCVTVDFHLWRFDREQARRSGGLPTMILPINCCNSFGPSSRGQTTSTDPLPMPSRSRSSGRCRPAGQQQRGDSWR